MKANFIANVIEYYVNFPFFCVFQPLVVREYFPYFSLSVSISIFNCFNVFVPSTSKNLDEIFHFHRTYGSLYNCPLINSFSIFFKWWEILLIKKVLLSNLGIIYEYKLWNVNWLIENIKVQWCVQSIQFDKTPRKVKIMCQDIGKWA